MPRKSAAMQALRCNLLINRAKHGLSQSDLAMRADVARQTISKLESGEGDVKVSVLERIARVFGCRVCELLQLQLDSKQVDDAELQRRAKTPQSEFIDADRLFAAIDESTRYSRAGRPRSVAHKAAHRRK